LNLKRFKSDKCCHLMKKAPKTLVVVHSRNAKNVQTSKEALGSRESGGRKC